MIIQISPDEMTCKVGDRTLKIGESIMYLNEKEKPVMGTIKEFRTIDQRDMKAPWCWCQENKTGETHWFSLTLWAAIQFPEQTQTRVFERDPNSPINLPELPNFDEDVSDMF